MSAVLAMKLASMSRARKSVWDMRESPFEVAGRAEPQWDARRGLGIQGAPEHRPSSAGAEVRFAALRAGHRARARGTAFAFGFGVDAERSEAMS